MEVHVRGCVLHSLEVSFFFARKFAPLSGGTCYVGVSWTRLVRAWPTHKFVTSLEMHVLCGVCLHPLDVSFVRTQFRTLCGGTCYVGVCLQSLDVTSIHTQFRTPSACYLGVPGSRSI